MAEKDEEVYTHDNGCNYNIIEHEDLEFRLFHSLDNARLEGEEFAEYKIRQKYVKKFLKESKKGTTIWFSKNTATITDYKIADYLVGLTATSEDTKEDSLKKAMHNLRNAEELALKTNLGTYNKKKIEEIVKKQNEDKKDEDK